MAYVILWADDDKIVHVMQPRQTDGTACAYPTLSMATTYAKYSLGLHKNWIIVEAPITNNSYEPSKI